MNVKADTLEFWELMLMFLSTGNVKVNSESEKDIVLAGVYVKASNREFGS